MARYKTINGITTECTPAEVAELDAMKADWDSKAFDRAIARLRFKRNQLLIETDWMANSDVTMSDDWKTYRQELRDLTNGLDTVEKVEAVEFPTKPSGE
jgi:TPP-dependent pyruvate/acetoin dehydrogenase alpha subunit